MSREINTVFQYNNAEYEFDIRDAEFSEKFENAIELMTEEEKVLPKVGKTSEIIKAQCKMIKDFFDRCLGDNAGISLCTERSNLSVCYDAYEKFLNFVRVQKNDITNVKNTFAKYSNRQQHRNNYPNKNHKHKK